MAAPSNAWVVDEEDEPRTTICAFCFRTSAGVRMKQETSSPVEEAAAWRIGRGMRGVVGEDGSDGLMVCRKVLVDS